MSDEPMSEQEVLDLILQGEAGHPRRPLLMAMGVILKAKRDRSVEDVPLEQFVTAESLRNWDLDQVAANLQGLGLFTAVEYRSPSWAEVKLVETDADGPIAVRENRVFMGIAFYVRFVDELGDWRVHMLGPPDLPIEELP